MAGNYFFYPPKGAGGGGGGSGTVTSVGLSAPSSVFNVTGSPVTTSGTLGLTFKTQAANTIFAGPDTGSAATPTFRDLVSADMSFLFGDLTDAGTDGIVITSGSGVVLGAGTSIAQHVADTSHNGYLSSTDWNTFNSKQSTITIGNLTDAGTDGIVVTGGLGAVIGSGTSIAQHVADTTHNGYLSSTDWNTFNGKQASGNYITALTGDVTASGPGSAAASLVAITNSTLTTLSGLTTASSLATVGTITSGTWNATTIAINHGGTGQTSASAAFNALSPITTKGDLIGGTGTNTAGRLAVGSNGLALVADSTQTTGLNWASVLTNPLTTKGDIITYSTQAIRHAVPADYGMLIADSAQTDGWRNTTYSQTQGKPGKNYIQYADFENGATTGWSLGTVGTLVNGIPTGSPTFGSGSSGNLSIAVVSSGQLAGASSLSYVSSAATTQGNMLASSAYAIDIEDQAKVLTFKFYYQAQSGSSNCNFSGTSSNSFGVAVYDVTNSSWLSLAGNFAMTQGSGIGIATGTCQTNATTASIRFVLYNANATAGAATLYLDDFYVGPQTAPYGPVMTDWVAYTPTFVGMGTVTSIEIYSRRVGQNLQVRGKFLAGTATGVTATMSLGFNGANGGITIAGTTAINNITIVGAGGFDNSGTNPSYILATNGATVVNFGIQNGTQGALTALNGTSFNNAHTFSFFAELPIAGWSSNVQMSNDTDTRVVAARMTGATATVTGSYSDITWTTVVSDTHGAMSTISYTVPVTGYYDIIGAIDVGAGSLSAAGGFFVGLNTGSIILENKFLFDLNVPENESLDFNYGSVFLSSGSTFKLQVKTTGTVGTPVINSSATTNFLAIKRLSGPAVIAATDSVNARYFASSTSISGSLATVVWTTKDFDNTNSMSSGVYTIPVTGKYQINSAVATTGTFALNNIVTLELQKNGTVVSREKNYAGGIVTDLSAQISDIISCLAGDTIRIQLSSGATGPSIVSSNFENYFSISRVGN